MIQRFTIYLCSFEFLLVAMVSLLLLSNVAATKLVALGPLILDGGFVAFPLTYVIGDVIAEVYGYRHSRRAVLTGLGISVAWVGTLWVVGALPPAPEYPHQAAFIAVLGFVPHIILASMAGYLAGQLLNALVLVRLKRRTNGRRLWLRLLGSSVIGQLVDTIIFCTIAFWGMLSGEDFVNYVLAGAGYKLVVEAACIPITYRLVARARRVRASQRR